MASCQVDSCRYSTFHNTENHQCGKCKRFGHGQRECGAVCIEKLNAFSIHDHWLGVLPKQNFKRDYSKTLNLTKIIESETISNIIIKPYNYGETDKSILSNLMLPLAKHYRKTIGTVPNTYIADGLGMGWCVYARSNSDCSVIKYLTLDDTEDQNIKTNKTLQNFILNHKKYEYPPKDYTNYTGFLFKP
jgi:hypothetical protein